MIHIDLNLAHNNKYSYEYDARMIHICILVFNSL